MKNTYVKTGSNTISCTIDGIDYTFHETLPVGLTVNDIPDGPYKDYLIWRAAGNTPINKSPKTFKKFYGNEKLDLFTREEQVKIITTTLTDPIVKLFYDRLINASYVTYEDAETEEGLTLLVEKGLITSERKVEIVNSMYE